MVTLDPRFAGAPGVDQIGQDIFRRLDALPGVEHAALTGLLPLEGNFNSLPITIVGRQLDSDPTHGNSRWMTVSPAYFDALKIPLMRGRVFTDADRRDAPPVALVNQAMARQFWPGRDPLNDRLVIGKGLGQDFGEPVRQVVGIVGDVREDALNLSPLPAVFVPSTQRPADTGKANSVWKMWVIARMRAPSQALHRAIERELRQATGLSVPHLRSMEEILARSTASQNFNMILMTIFGSCSLLLAAIGIYGLLAHSVQQRSREMGIRMALGAEPGDVRNMVFSQGMSLVWIGAGIGIAAAFGLTRFIESFLFGVKALDPAVFVTVPILLTCVALVAVWVPARRASRVDPAEALRCD
jgi:putative ABC transport system permease protein